MASSLFYLTVQDVLWINMQVTRQVNTYRYADLEEATFYQYAYGESNSLLPQAARFVRGFLNKAPLAHGNEATAFVALAAFLKVNGTDLDLEDGAAIEWFRRIQTGQDAGDLIRSAAKGGHERHGEASADVRGAMRDVLRAFPNTISELSGVQLNFAADGAVH
jgi:prophage maintenance system killer protein